MLHVNIEVRLVAVLVLGKVEVGGGLLELELPDVRVRLEALVEQGELGFVAGDHLGLDLRFLPLGVGLLLDLRRAPRGSETLAHGVRQAGQ